MTMNKKAGPIIRAAVVITAALFFSCPSFSQESFPFLGEITGKRVNIRSGQSESFEKIGRLDEGARVVVTGKSYDWYKIKLPANANSYISDQFVQMLGEGVGEITGTRVNVRAAADLNSFVIGKLSKGDLVRVLGEEKGWFRIEPADTTSGWVAAGFVRFASDRVPPPRVVERPAPPKKTLIVKKSEEKPAPADIIVTGVVENITGNNVSDNVRHRINTDKGVYYLKGYRRMLDGFLSLRVEITGRAQDETAADAPVLLVRKISLVL